jgi:threonine synthase
MKIACLNCGRPYPDSGAPFQCPKCGGLFDHSTPLAWQAPEAGKPGIWRYASSLDLTGEDVSLGEGRTPLVSVDVGHRQILFKCEYANPSGSFKDRGAAALIAFLKSRGVTDAVEDSSGNAGAAFAAYAARAGIHASVFVPTTTSGPKIAQIVAYGAELIKVEGPRSAAAAAARSAASDSVAYASHANFPQNLAGYASCAFEIAEEARGGPGTVVVPAGQGGLLLGMGRGFQALLAAGEIKRMPVLIGVQAATCAPLAALAEVGPMGLNLVTEGETIAEGVRTRSPLRAQAVVQMVLNYGGRFIAIPEERILPARDALARMGFYVEPTSALVWAAVEGDLDELPHPVVAVLTGSGYKSKIQ